jgi:hypothetical protein
VASRKDSNRFIDIFRDRPFYGGRVEWIDIAAMKNWAEESDEVVIPFLPYHRIIDVRSITLIR